MSHSSRNSYLFQIYVIAVLINKFKFRQMIIEFIGAYCHYTPSQSMDTTSLSPTEWESNNVEVEKGQWEISGPTWGSRCVPAPQMPLQGYSQNATWGLMWASPTGAPRPLHMTRLALVCGVVVPDDF